MAEYPIWRVPVTPPEPKNRPPTMQEHEELLEITQRLAQRIRALEKRVHKLERVE